MKTFIDHDIPSIKRIDSPNGRVYQTPTGMKYPSVTSVLGMMDKSSFFEWRKRVGDEEANRVSARASSRGTRIHSLCEDFITTGKASPGMFDAEMFNSIKPYLDKINYNRNKLRSLIYS